MVLTLTPPPPPTPTTSTQVRWVNHHLAAAGSERKITNFAGDIKDGEVYLQLLKSLNPSAVSLDMLTAAPADRASAVITVSKQSTGRHFLSPRVACAFYLGVVCALGHLFICLIFSI